MATLAKPRAARKPLTPATGSCRWAVQPGIGHFARPGCLVITSLRSDGKSVTEAYIVTENLDGVCLVGYRLEKPDGTVYDLPADLSGCDCPDAVYRRSQAKEPELRACKHVRGLRKALADLDSESF